METIKFMDNAIERTARILDESPRLWQWNGELKGKVQEMVKLDVENEDYEFYKLEVAPENETPWDDYDEENLQIWYVALKGTKLHTLSLDGFAALQTLNPSSFADYKSDYLEWRAEQEGMQDVEMTILWANRELDDIEYRYCDLNTEVYTAQEAIRIIENEYIDKVAYYFDDDPTEPWELEINAVDEKAFLEGFERIDKNFCYIESQDTHEDGWYWMIRDDCYEPNEREIVDYIVNFMMDCKTVTDKEIEKWIKDYNPVLNDDGEVERITVKGIDYEPNWDSDDDELDYEFYEGGVAWMIKNKYRIWWS